MKYRSTKTFGHDLGLSACFRQWRADGHCAQLHGYALAFILTFEGETLDERNWIVDFGDLKDVRKWLEGQFDHCTLVARDDPHLHHFHALHDAGIITLRTVHATGCESFARMVYGFVNSWLETRGYAPRVRLVSVECREHGANSALFMGQVV